MKHICVYLTIIQLIQINFISLKVGGSPCWEMQPYCACDYNIIDLGDALFCENFNFFIQLNFTLLGKRIFHSLTLYPQQPNILNNKTLNLKDITIEPHGYVRLSNIDSFDMESNPFENVNPTGAIKNLQIYQSNIKFVSSSNKCDGDVRKYESTIFSYFKEILISGGSTYHSPLCPFMFHNSKLDFLDMVSNFEFEQLSLDNGLLLNSNIRQFQLTEIDIVMLDHKLLDKFIFNRIEKFGVYFSHLKAIDDLVFTNFKSLNTIILDLYDMSDFFSNLNNSTQNWISGLSAPVGHQLLVTFSDKNSFTYKYPDKDFCKFASFPHGRDVFVSLVIYSSNPFDCTCTILWLLKNYNLYENSSVINNTNVAHCLGSNFLDLMDKCDFDRRVSECGVSLLTDTTISPTTTTTITSPTISIPSLTSSITTTTTTIRTDSSLTSPPTTSSSHQSTKTTTTLSEEKEPSGSSNTLVILLATIIPISVVIIGGIIFYKKYGFSVCRRMRNNSKKEKKYAAGGIDSSFDDNNDKKNKEKYIKRAQKVDEELCK